MQHARFLTSIQYAVDQAPDPGTTVPIVPGVHWLRMPLPFALSHINLWLLEGLDSWNIVDTGVSNKDTRVVWQRIFTDVTRQAPIERVFVTHMHPDHAGSAGWLCDELGAELWMSREEYFLCRILTADTGRETPAAGKDFYHAAGFPPQSMDRYKEMFGMFGRLVSPLPQSYMRLQDGDDIEIGADKWTVIVGRGHSPEHACLYSANSNLLISGDQLLPKISSNVSVFPTEPAANPLADWLASLSDLKNRIPEDVLVLPAHGKPFTGAHARLEQLIDEHHSCLDDLENHCREPRRAVDTFSVLFKSEIRANNLIMATGESIAHLNYMIAAGRIERTTDSSGIHWYNARR
jgi:glyoxylase-like metal-dependent hydrolase (beta-lactamase superfamily II)